jgi:hypothetical protein
MDVPSPVDTAKYRRLVLQLLNTISTSGGGGGGGGGGSSFSIPSFNKKTFTSTSGNITTITYFNGSTQVAHRDLTYSGGQIATDTLSIP